MPTPSEIQTCINNLTTSSQPIDFTLLAAETSNANTGISFSVATVDDLPDLETTSIGTGQIFFVESIGVPVVSTVNEWKGLDGRLLRRDFLIKSIFSWGFNVSGLLGDGTTTNRCSPVREFCSATDWCAVSTNSLRVTQNSAIKSSGQLWVWGSNSCGQLGDGTQTNRCSPVREICSATDWCQIGVGNCHMAAVKTSGQLWAWGQNNNVCPFIGDGTTESKCSPVREFCSATDWHQVGAGGCHTVAIKISGELWAWGRNSCGQLGDGTATTRCSPVREICSATDWCQVSAGNYHTAAIKTSGELWSWGAGASGRLGVGTTVDRLSPAREICSETDWCQVSAGVSSTVAIKTSGELWTWGRNLCGVLGDGTTVDKCSPVREISSSTDWCQVSVAQAHGAAIKTTGQLWSWGCNSTLGTLGAGSGGDRCSPVREFCSATGWCQVSAGNSSSTAIIFIDL